MHLVVLVPDSIRVDFSTLVDQFLSRDLDWNLVLFEDVLLEGSRSTTSCRSLVYSSLECPLPGVFHRGLQELSSRYPECLSQLDNSSVWLFSLSPLCLVDDVDKVIDHMRLLGCHIGLTASYPCRVDG